MEKTLSVEIVLKMIFNVFYHASQDKIMIIVFLQENISNTEKVPLHLRNKMCKSVKFLLT